MIPTLLTALLVGSLSEILDSVTLKFGGVLVLLVALVDSSFLTVPEGNDLLIVVLSAGKSWSWMLTYVSLTITGSIIGCILLYSVGRKGGSPLLRLKFSDDSIRRVEGIYARYGVLSVVIPSILPPPCPFKIFVLSAGVFRLSVTKFIGAVAIGRTIRYLAWGILAVVYGNPIKLFIQTNLREIGIVALIILIPTAAIAIAAYLRRSRKVAGRI